MNRRTESRSSDRLNQPQVQYVLMEVPGKRIVYEPDSGLLFCNTQVAARLSRDRAAILTHLVQHPDEVVSVSALNALFYPAELGADASREEIVGNRIHVSMTRLRTSLNDAVPQLGEMIQTTRGEGFSFIPHASVRDRFRIGS